MDGSGPSVGVVYRPTRGEGGDGRAVPGDIMRNMDWARSMHLVDVLGPQLGLTPSLHCFQPKTHVSTNELMGRLTSVINLGCVFSSKLHEARPELRDMVS